MTAVDPRQVSYEAARAEHRRWWLISEAEDFCARKGVEPETYKPVVEGSGGA